MDRGPLTLLELGTLLVVLLPWLAGAAVAVAVLVLLRRLVRAAERIARTHGREEGDG